MDFQKLWYIYQLTILTGTQYYLWNMSKFIQFAWCLLPNCSYNPVSLLLLETTKTVVCFVLNLILHGHFVPRHILLLWAYQKRTHLSLLFCLFGSFRLSWPPLFWSHSLFFRPFSNYYHLVLIVSIFKIRLWTTSKFLLSCLLQVLSTIHYSKAYFLLILFSWFMLIECALFFTDMISYEIIHQQRPFFILMVHK